MESTRQSKISKLLQIEVADIIQKQVQIQLRSTFITVSKVMVTRDMSIARFYLSIFPSENAKETVKFVEENASLIRKLLGNKVRNQLRIVPNLEFYIDDSLDYIQNLENLLQK